MGIEPTGETHPSLNGSGRYKKSIAPAKGDDQCEVSSVPDGDNEDTGRFSGGTGEPSPPKRQVRFGNLFRFLQKKQNADSLRDLKFVVTPRQYERLEALFRKMDIDCDGYLSKEELEIFHEQAKWPEPERRVDSVLQNLIQAGVEHAEFNEDGLLDYEEFLEFLIVKRSTILSRHWTKIEVCIVICWFSLSPLMYCNFNQEEKQWAVWDALYFAAATVTTVGYGDFAPISDEMKMFTIVYVLSGVVMVARIISEFAEYSVKKYEANLHKMNASVSKALSRRKETRFSAWTRALAHNWKIVRWYQDNWSVLVGISIAVLLVMIPIIIGTIFVHFNEGWTFVNSVYWSCVTITSVGYGDIVVSKPSSRIFAFFFILCGFACLGAAFARLADLKMGLRFEKKKADLLSRSLSLNLLADMDRDGHGIDRCEFVCAMLAQLDIVTQDEVTPILRRFDELDVDGSGILNRADLQVLRRRKRADRERTMSSLYTLTLSDSVFTEREAPTLP